LNIRTGLRFGLRTADGGRIFVAALGVQPELQLVLRSMGFTDREEGFAIEVLGDKATREAVIANWKDHGPAVVEQAVGLRPVPWPDALRAFVRSMDGSDVWWFLVGSGGLAVRGLDIAPGDLDIVTDRDGIYALTQIFKDQLLEPVVEGRGWFFCELAARLFLHARIDVVGNVRGAVDDPQPRPFGPEAASRIEMVEWDGFEIPVAPLDLQLVDELSRSRRASAAQILRAMEMDAASR
jgi:hypothetical protein